MVERREAMPHSRNASQTGAAQGFEMERKYSVPSNPDFRSQMMSGAASEDLHAWSIYRQNLNSDFTDSALGSTDKSPLPYGNFQLRDTTVQSILSHPRYGPKSALGSNMYTYLKFGLPRVFPPNHNGSNRSTTPQHFTRGPNSRPLRGPKTLNRGLRDGSSGYDSSDNETQHQYKQNRKYRSDPDFRMQNVHPSYHHQHGMPPPGGLPLPGMRPPTAAASGGSHWVRNKSISEANLLNSDIYGTGPAHLRHPNNRRNSVAEFHHPEHIENSVLGHPIGRPISKAGSDISMMHSRRGNSVMRGDYIHDQEIGPTFVYPHLQVRSLEITSPQNKRMLLLQNISFEIRGGEVMAVMATSDAEGTGLLDTIAGLRNPVGGDIILNGQNISKNILRPRVAYAQNDSHLCKELTTQQTLRFHYDLKKPTEKLDHLKIDAIDRINVLIEDLGLDQVRNTKVENLTTSEKRRLNVACHLLLDTDIVVLDQPTRGMDIFDTFFLVEYLRQWATGGSGNTLGRIVILTLHPPTYEIFTMLSRVLLLSAGRTMYSGKRRDMLAYFSMVEYPCPSFKNPSDYYLDLVTLDDLSAEAMLESSQRIEQLADVFRRKQEPLSDPGPPTTLPLTARNTNCLKRAYVLFTKSMFYSQPNTFISWTQLFIIAVTLSLIIGAIFWDVPNTDAQLTLNDRLGYHYTVMCVATWPILLSLTLNDVKGNRRTVERDIRDGLYGRFTYIFMKTFLNLFPSAFIWLVYLVPCYSMSGLYMQGPNNYNGFYIYIGYMLLYLCSSQSLLTAFAYVVRCSHSVATIFTGCTLAVGALASGYPVHIRDIPWGVQWFNYINPTAWLLPILANREYTQEAISSSAATTLCRNKQIQRQDIIVQLPCPPPNGTQVMSNFGFLSSQQEINYYGHPAFSLLAFYLIFFIITCLGFVINCCNSNKEKKRQSDSNKP